MIKKSLEMLCEETWALCSSLQERKAMWSAGQAAGCIFYSVVRNIWLGYILEFDSHLSIFSISVSQSLGEQK